MKILVLLPFGTNKYDNAIKQVLNPAKRSDTELTVDHLEEGPNFFRYMYIKAMTVPFVIERVIKAEKDGYDGVFISCSNDPGVKEAQEIVEIPVVGGLLPSIYLAKQLGQQYGFITDTDIGAANQYDQFKMHKIDIECVGLKSINYGIDCVEKDPETNNIRVIEVAQELVKSGAEVIVIGCTVVSAYFMKENINLPNDLKGITFLDANVCSLKTLEMMVDLKKKCNVGVSRKIYYSKPQDAVVETFKKVRKMYGWD